MKVKSEDIEKANKLYAYQQGIDEVRLEFENKFLKQIQRGGGVELEVYLDANSGCN